jgi:hypothetical protein
MKILTIVLATGALVTGLWAAYKWFKASTVRIDPGYTYQGMKPGATFQRFGIDLPRFRKSGDLSFRQLNMNAATLDTVALSMKLNKAAAIWTSASVALSAVATFLGACER